MNIVKHYKENKARNVTFFKNVQDIFFHIHNGKKRVVVGFVSLAVNIFVVYKRFDIQALFSVFLVEYVLIKISEALTNEGMVG